MTDIICTAAVDFFLLPSRADDDDDHHMINKEIESGLFGKESHGLDRHKAKERQDSQH